MTGMDMNAPAPLYATGIVAERDTAYFDDLAARQSRLTAEMCQTFFRQLKLINTMMIEFPLGWFAGRAELETMPEELAELCETPAIEIAPATPTIELSPASTPAPAEPLVNEAAPVEPIEVSETLPARRRQRKGKTSRSNPKG